MTILQINKFYFEKGGAERYFFSLKELLEKNRHQVIPFAMQSSNNLPCEIPGVRRGARQRRAISQGEYFVSEISIQPSWNIFKNFKTIFRFWWSCEARRKLEKLIVETRHASSLQGGIDIAHIHNIYHQISPSILPVLKKHNIPVVMTVHDYHLISSNYNLYKRKKANKYFVQNLICAIERILHHNILNIYKKNINLFIAPSEFVKNKLIKAGFAKDRIKVVGHFIYPSHPPLRKGRDKNSPPYEFKVASGKFKRVRGGYILYFGRLSEEKGIGVLIEAMRKLPNIKLKIAGTGTDKKEYGLRIKEYGLDNIEMLGYRNKDELQNLILNSQFVIVPSLAPETFGLSALEAMALGKCVVASNIGALPELINKDYLVKPGDVNKLVKKIQRLTSKPEYVRMNGQENRKRVLQDYEEKAHYKEIFKIYQSVKEI